MGNHFEGNIFQTSFPEVFRERKQPET